MTSAFHATTTMNPTLLRSVPTVCGLCRTKTPERVVASRWIRTAHQNRRFGGLLCIVECAVCGLQYLNPRPHPQDLQHVYDFTTYADSTNENPALMAHFYAALQAHKPDARRVLEIGCGKGTFLAWMQARGLDCDGVEYSESAERDRQFTGTIHYGPMEDLDLPPASYDAIFLLNTIEHLADPLAVVEKVQRMLRPGGIFLLRHPNTDLFTFPLYRYTIELAKLLVHRLTDARFTLMGFRNQHLFYFTPQTVSTLLERAGFTVLDVSTNDPYNALRARRAWRAWNAVEGAIASLRHALGYIGLGPECLVIARRAE